MKVAADGFVLTFWAKKPAARSPAPTAGADYRQKLMLHIGPHKTGTTSLQKALLKQYGAERPKSVWYPLPSDTGPGHAVIARAMLGRKTPTAKPHPALSELLHLARRSDCDLLLLSSEVFSTAFPSKLDLLAEQFSDAEPHILVTLSPFGRRAVSIWQERLKHKSPITLEDAKEGILTHSGLSPDLVPAFAETFPAAKVSVIIVNQAKPLELYELFADATGVPLSAPRSSAQVMANQGLGMTEAEMLRAFNAAVGGSAFPDDKYKQARNMLRALFTSEKWRTTVPMVPLRVPLDWIEPLRAHCADTIRRLRELAATGRIEVFGDLDRLDDLTPLQGKIVREQAAPASREGKMVTAGANQARR